MSRRQHNTLPVVIVPRAQADAESTRRLRAIVDIALAPRPVKPATMPALPVSPAATPHAMGSPAIREERMNEQ